MSAKTELELIAQEVASCTKCSLCKTRTRTVPGEGSPTSRVMFIGEAPGYHEDQQGRPFVGNSGELLNKLLAAIKMPRQDVFIANVIKCRPPNNQDPTDEQITACKPYLDRQIAAINPGVIVTLGRFSMRRFFPGALISKVHGQAKEENGRVVLPMFHPSAALRDQSRRTMMMFKEDGLTIPALLERADEMARTELWGQATAETADADQPTLGHTTPPRLAEPSARESYLADAPAVILPPEPASTVALVPDETAVPLIEASVAGEQPPAPGPKLPRTPRKPKPAAAPELEQELALVGLKPLPRTRKKRPPEDGEQLRMF